jgi:hypothetical protein
MTEYADKKEAEILQRLDDATSGKTTLTPEEQKALSFDSMLFLIRTRGL